MMTTLSSIKEHQAQKDCSHSYNETCVVDGRKFLKCNCGAMIPMATDD